MKLPRMKALKLPTQTLIRKTQTLQAAQAALAVQVQITPTQMRLREMQVIPLQEQLLKEETK